MKDVVASRDGWREMLISIARDAWREIMSHKLCWRRLWFGSNLKLECVPKFCYLGDTLGAWGVGEAARARVRCTWAKFKELCSILAARDASYHITGKIYKFCVQCVDIWDNGTETMAMNAGHLNCLERTERMMVRWVYDCMECRWRIERAVCICSLFGIQNVADVARRDRLRWFGHLERRSVDD